MKTRIYLCAVLALSVLLIAGGCGRQAGEISLGADNYGKTTLANGITVLVNHDETTSLSSARFLIGGGVLTETAENNGITNLMTKMLLKGNDVMTASEITERLDFLGANVGPGCFRDYSVISFTSLTENFDEVLGIISQCLISPTFPEDELAKLKLETEGDIRTSDDNQSAASNKLFWKTAYGDQGYGLPTLGTQESIAGINADDIRAHYDRFVGGGNLIFSISTDMPVADIRTMISSHLGGIRKDAEKIAPPAMTLGSEKTGFISFDRNQSFVYRGTVLPHLQPNEVAYIYLLNKVMGGGVGSRLWGLRFEEKLAYAVYTQYAFDRYGATLVAAIGTDTTKVKTALKSLEREWGKMTAEGLTEEELTDARVNMKNGLIYSIDTKSNRANNMAYYEYVGYGYKFVLELIEMADKVTLADLNTFVKTNFTGDRLFTSIVGKK